MNTIRVIGVPVGTQTKKRGPGTAFPVILFFFAALAASACWGGLVGLAGVALRLAGGEPVSGITASFTALATVLTAAEVVGKKEVRPPSRAWQVPREWRNHGLAPFSTMFGAILGVGFLTYITTWGYFALVGFALWTADPLPSAAVFGLYGIGRGGSVVVAYLDVAATREHALARSLLDAKKNPRSWWRRARIASLSLFGAALALSFVV